MNILNIRKYIFTLCVIISSILVISGCSSRLPVSIEPTGSMQCILKGEVIDRPQSKRIVLRKKGESSLMLGNVYIPIKKGKFEYKLNFDQEELYVLIFEDEFKRSDWRIIEFISEQAVVNFKLHPRYLTDINIVEGGPINKEYLNYRNEASNKSKELEPYKSFKAKFKQITGTDLISADTKDLYDQTMREDTTYQEWLLWKLQYAREHPNVVGYGVLLSEMISGLKRINDFTPYLEAYQTIFAPKYPDHPYTAQVNNLFTASSLKAGTSFIDFSAVDFTGKPVKLSEQIAGKPAVLHLWASWCAPCRKKGMELIPVYEEFRDKGFVVIGVARESGSSAAAQAAVKSDKYPWVNLVEINDVEKIWVKYGMESSAGSDFLIDENGIIVSVAPSIDEVRNFLKKYTPSK